MSIINKLTEGIVNRDMTAEGEALLNKWSSTGLLEGLDGDVARNNMARLLENQAKQLLKEASSMGGTGGAVDGFAAVAFPIVRRVFAGLIANDLVSVQPMSLPSGLIFFLDFKYSPSLGSGLDQTTAAGGDRFGNLYDKSIYGTDQVGSQITGGVDLVGTVGENHSGPRQLVGGAHASATGSATAIASGKTGFKAQFTIAGVSEENAKLIQFDPDLLSNELLEVCIVDVNIDQFNTLDTPSGGLADFNNLGAFNIERAELEELLDNTKVGDNVRVIRRLTQRIAADADPALSSTECIRFVIADLAADMTAGLTFAAVFDVECPVTDTMASSTSSGGAITSYALAMENLAEIPEIDILVDSIAITATTKKLKAKWSPELGQDLNAYHNLDAEVELTSILSEQVALEIDREILADLVNGATAGKLYWSRSPGLFVDRVTGLEIGESSKAPDFTGTVSEWYETLIETINDVSAQIHRKTLRGGANFVVCSPEVANILEFTAGFRANVTADADKGEIGAVKVGSLSRKFDVVVDPYFPRNVILVGRKGASFLESGYVYAPYVPLQVTPTIFGVEDFVPRKGVMTRYAKKMVRPDMYGLVICRGLNGEDGG